MRPTMWRRPTWILAIPAGEPMPKSKVSAFLTLLLVFVSGTVLGAVAHRLYMVNTVVATKRPSPEEFRKRQVSEMRDRVKMDDAQVTKFNEILDHTKTQFDLTHEQFNAKNHAILEEQRNEVRAMLKPDQLALYDQVVAEHDAARKQRARDRDKK
jgi:hypothetical protein